MTASHALSQLSYGPGKVADRATDLAGWRAENAAPPADFRQRPGSPFGAPGGLNGCIPVGGCMPGGSGRARRADGAGMVGRGGAGAAEPAGAAEAAASAALESAGREKRKASNAIRKRPMPSSGSHAGESGSGGGGGSAWSSCASCESTSWSAPAAWSVELIAPGLSRGSAAGSSLSTDCGQRLPGPAGPRTAVNAADRWHCWTGAPVGRQNAREPRH